VILQVHDELVLEVREDLVEQVSDEIRQHMSGAASWTCRCWWKWASANWDEAH
jgi:DNA polymerase-1